MSSVNILTTPTPVAPLARRGAAILQNRSDVEIFVGFGDDVTAAAGPASGIGIAPGGDWTLTDLPGDSSRVVHTPIYAVHAGAGEKELRIITI